jgi:hypothetical protein
VSERATPAQIQAAPVSLSAAARFSFVQIRKAWPALVLCAAAVVAQAILGTSTDVSWLTTLCEKMLDGQRPYVDVIESNPPAAFLIYMPAVLAARAIGVAPEFMIGLFGFSAIGASVGLCTLILSRAGLAHRFGPGGLVLVLVVLAVLPGAVFDQREHLALAAGLPLLATLAARASSAEVGLALRVVAGLGAAIMASIKPYFALMIIATLPYLGWRIGLKGLVASLELYSTAIFGAFSVAAVFAFFPAYLDKVAPLVAAIYLPQRQSWLTLATNPGLLCWLVLGRYVILLGRDRLGDPLVAIPGLASLGAVAAFLLQGKGWPYQVYPAVALIALALGPLISKTPQATRQHRLLALPAICAGTLVIAFGYFCNLPRQDSAALERLVASVAPHPKIVVIGSDIALGHPLTRNVGGVWVGTFPFLWITDTIYFWREQGKLDSAAEARYAPFLRYDRETLVADIDGKKPDAILIADDNWKGWAFSHTDLAAALADYTPVGAVGEVTVYGRKLGLRRLNSDNDPP